MNRNIINGLVAGLVAVAAFAAPASAGYGHRAHHGKFHVVHAHKVHHFHAYRKVHYVPVCKHFEWKYSYGKKQLVCVAW